MTPTISIHCSEACTIQFDDKVIVIGGEYTSNTVSVYTMDGWKEDLPDLVQGRKYAGCGHFKDSNNETVSYMFK